MARPKFAYLYVTVEGVRKFRGFLVDRATAEKWVAKQEDPVQFEISDEGPPRREVTSSDATINGDDDVAITTETGLNNALAAVRGLAAAEKASDQEEK